MPRTRSLPAIVVALAVLAALLAAPSPVAAVSTETTDALQVVKADEAPTNAEIAVRLSEETPLAAGGTVLVGRDDEFADSLASGSLQSDSPLLLVPPQGPIPDRVIQELDRLAPARVVLLGGVLALGQVVEDELASRYPVERREGVSRFETAIAIAERDIPQADTAILSRAFPAEGGDRSQAFADALAAGGMAAAQRWPVLLTQTDVLSEPTRQYLESSSIRTLYLMGGTAAISESVQQELQAMGIATERLSGANRADTALEVAKILGADSAADVARVTVVEGEGREAWAGGFAAAAHSALFNAPIVLTSGEQLPPETEEFLAGRAAAFSGTEPDVDAPVLTCITMPAACEASRVAAGLPASATVTFDPPPAADLAPGEEITVTATGGDPALAQQSPAAGEVVVDGTCVDDPTTGTLDAPVTVQASQDLPVPCTVQVSLELSNGAVQTTRAIYPGGTIEGTVRDATDGERIAGATVTVAGRTVPTAADGTFAVTNLEPGRYAVTATAEGYLPGDTDRVTVAAAETTTIDVLLSPELAEGDVRIVLTWSDDPRDLDSHLWLPPSEPFHIYYANRGSLDACPFAALDIDDVSGFGPETITITESFPGTYRYAVHKFAGDATLSQSEARVEVYDTTGLVAQFEVPRQGTDQQRWWHVFDLEPGTGQLTPVNRLADTEEQVQPYADPLRSTC